MGSLDPLSAFALQAIANAQASIEEATLNLGALVDTLRSQVSIGQVLTATVLPPENGADRLQLLGQTVAAQLPPGIFPGETVALQVTGFTASAVLVRNLGAIPTPESTPAPQPQAALSEAPAVQTPVPQAPETPQLPRTGPPQPASPPAGPPHTAAPQTVSPRTVPPQTVPPQTVPPQTAPPQTAPPREIFVAASVRPSAQPAPSFPIKDAPLPPDLEARIAATRAAPPLARSSGAAPLKPGDVTIAVQRAVVDRAAAQRQIAPTPSPVTSTRTTPEVALLARLRVPISAVTLAAARLVETATQSATSAFERLDALLAKQPPSAELLPLRSTLAFVARMDLRNTATLPEQIAAYVSNVVGGSEAKIAQLVRAWTAAVAENALASQPSASPAPQPNEMPLPAGPAPSAQPAPGTVVQTASQDAAANAGVPVTVAARAAERDVALAHDMKSALLALATAPAEGSSPQVVAAVREALTATTAVQLNALQAQNAEPNVITIALPAYFHHNGEPARLRISKDAPGAGRNALDGDNFHIAFILDTASLGTVAIDLQTVGRNVSVDVKTETPRAADRFRSTMGDLRGCLEDLHYRVAAFGAAMASRPTAPQAPAPAPRSDANVDMQA